MPIRHYPDPRTVKPMTLRAAMKLGAGAARIGEAITACPFKAGFKRGWWEAGWRAWTERNSPRSVVHTGCTHESKLTFPIERGTPES